MFDMISLGRFIYLRQDDTTNSSTLSTRNLFSYFYMIWYAMVCNSNINIWVANRTLNKNYNNHNCWSGKIYGHRPMFVKISQGVSSDSFIGLFVKSIGFFFAIIEYFIYSLGVTIIIVYKFIRYLYMCKY